MLLLERKWGYGGTSEIYSREEQRMREAFVLHEPWSRVAEYMSSVSWVISGYRTYQRMVDGRSTAVYDQPWIERYTVIHSIARPIMFLL